MISSSLKRLVIGGEGAAGAKEEIVHLFLQELSGLGVHGAQAVFVDEHGLMTKPVLPGLSGYILKDAFAEFARIGRTVQTLSHAAELDAIYRSVHDKGASPLNVQ
jgi:hypothetical protein